MRQSNSSNTTTNLVFKPVTRRILNRLTFRLYTYTKLESLPLRSAVRNVHIVIFKDTDIDDTDDIAYPLAKTKFRDGTPSSSFVASFKPIGAPSSAI